MDNAAFQTTDDAPAVAVLAAVRHCANSWEGSARLLGNIRAIDIARACSEAIAALSPSREEIIEECAKLCEGLRHVDYPSETSEWSSGTFDCAQAVRALKKVK